MIRILAILWLVITIGPIFLNFGVYEEIPTDYYSESINEETGEVTITTYDDLQEFPMTALYIYIIGLVIGAIGNSLVHANQPVTAFKVWFYIAGNEVGNFETSDNSGARVAGHVLRFTSFCLKIAPLILFIIGLDHLGIFDLSGFLQ